MKTELYLWLDVHKEGIFSTSAGESLKGKPPHNAAELSSKLTALRSNNAKWMNIGATQMR